MESIHSLKEINKVVTSNEKVITATLSIAWFETKKQTIERDNSNGDRLLLRLPKNHQWAHGDLLYVDDELVATICIDECLTICYTYQNLNECADFCYYVANRHLPIFASIDQKELMVAYDGKLYEQLIHKFSSAISLASKQLLPENTLEALIKNSK